MQAGSLGSDVDAYQNAGCSKPANEHVHTHAYTSTQFDITQFDIRTIFDSFSRYGHAQPKSDSTDRHPVTDGHTARSFGYTFPSAAY